MLAITPTVGATTPASMPPIARISRRAWVERLNAGEFFLAYQPIMGGGSQVIAMEALLRWHPKESPEVVSPALFVPELERTKAIVDVGAWVLFEACKAAALWRERGHDSVAVAVNISPLQLRDPDFALRVKAAMRAWRVPPELLKLEITESMATHQEPALVDTLRQVEGLGVTLSLDDFGSGFANLMGVVRLPIREIKIDRGFITDVLSNAANRVVIESIVELANKLSLQVIAEGIEQSEQHAYLVSAGCNAFQGYFFGRPDSRLIILGGE